MGSIQYFLTLALFMLISLLGPACCDESLQDKCSPELAKLMVCLDFASNKADVPSGPCCASVSDIRGRSPVCLCYIIQQVHDSGSASVKSLGLQIDRLIQLPSACKLGNSSISDCPKLLQLSPSSPDYAIFTNTTTKATSPPATGSASTGTKSQGLKHQVCVGSTFSIVVVSAVFLSLFSVGS